jgi:spermidine/putrescine transport system ATP-binding protein
VPGRIEIAELKKRFPTPEGGEVLAVDGVSITIEPNEFFVMLGPSGCGKTTVLRCIAGLEHPDAGTITLDDERIDDKPAYDRPVTTVFQSYALFPHMTVQQNIAFGLQQQKLSRKVIAQRAAEALDLVRLSGLDRRKPHQLSGGQQQRVALARALAVKPKVLLLDEPLAALDLKLRREMQGELKRLQREAGITFVFVTHDQEEALALGDRIAVFRSGKLEQVGTPTTMYEEPQTAFVAGFLGETNVIAATADSDGVVRLPGGFATLSAPMPFRSCPVLVAVRPERLTFADPDAPSGSRAWAHLIGTVSTKMYLGNEIRYDVLVEPVRDGATEGVQFIRVQVRQPLTVPARRPEPGDRVGLRADQTMVRFLPVEG